MVTFLPYSEFVLSAALLDYRRLGKQRVEAKQILDILLDRTESKAWVNHPAVRMWRGYENSLKTYYNSILSVWICSGYKNNMLFEMIEGEIVDSPWLGNKDFHASHRSNLLRKNYDYYSKYGWTEPLDLPYIWPE